MTRRGAVRSAQKLVPHTTPSSECSAVQTPALLLGNPYTRLSEDSLEQKHVKCALSFKTSAEGTMEQETAETIEGLLATNLVELELTNTPSAKDTKQRRNSTAHARDYNELAKSRSHNMGSYFMKARDYEKASLNKVMPFIWRAGMLEG